MFVFPVSFVFVPSDFHVLKSHLSRLSKYGVRHVESLLKVSVIEITVGLTSVVCT